MEAEKIRQEIIEATNNQIAELEQCLKSVTAYYAYIVKVNPVYTVGIDEQNRTFLNNQTPHVLSRHQAEQTLRGRYFDNEGKAIVPTMMKAEEFLLAAIKTKQDLLKRWS